MPPKKSAVSALPSKPVKPSAKARAKVKAATPSVTAAADGTDADAAQSSHADVAPTQNVTSPSALGSPSIGAADTSAAAVEATSEDEVTVTGVGKKKRADAVPQWKNDAATLGQPSSISVLLSWLRDDDDYTKWKGSEGDTHIVLASDIAQLIKEAKTKVDRTPAAIAEKIKALEKSFREANDFRMATGQNILDKASAEEGDDAERKMKQAETTVDMIVQNICPHYFELAEVMSDRISANPTGSYSTTSASDRASSALRAAVAARNPESESDDEETMSSSMLESAAASSSGENLSPAPVSKKVKVEKEDRKGHPSDSGRKFGKADKTDPKRKVSAVEAALEERSREKTKLEREKIKMDSELNSVQVRAAKIAAIMQVARELREHDPTLDFKESLEQAKAVYNDIDM